MVDLTVVIATPTAGFRMIRRDSMPVVQQRFNITHGAGGVKERTTLVWLDVEHEMFQEAESPTQEQARKDVEAAYQQHRLTLRPGVPT